MKFILIKIVRFYQLYISTLIPSSCRYYPSCSEYFLWSIKNSGIFYSILKTSIRILKCNPFYKFGFDYPIVIKNEIPKSKINNNIKILFWFIPIGNNRYFLIKSIKEI